MLNDSVLKVSPHGSFKVSQLCKSIAICEATVSDRLREKIDETVSDYLATA
jgi:hypothetical protein